MINCELCGNYFHPDEIERCPSCDIELCPSCYEEHINACLSICDDNDFEADSANIPSECPECGTHLELDINYGENGYKKELYCPNHNCDYSIDVTQLLVDDEEDQNE